MQYGTVRNMYGRLSIVYSFDNAKSTFRNSSEHSPRPLYAYLQEECVLQHPRHIERARQRAHADDEPIVLEHRFHVGLHRRSAGDFLVREVDVLRGGKVEVVGVLKALIPHRLDDGAELERADGGARQKRREEEVVPWAHLKQNASANTLKCVVKPSALSIF